MHDGVLAAGQAVEQRGLAHVWASDQCHRHLFAGDPIDRTLVGVVLRDRMGVDEGLPRRPLLHRAGLDAHPLGQQFDDGVQQVACAASVKR